MAYFHLLLTTPLAESTARDLDRVFEYNALHPNKVNETTCLKPNKSGVE